MSCNKCGMCCKALLLSISQKDLRLAAMNTVESEFKDQAILLLDILEPITREKAIEINHRLDKIKAQGNFFKCTKLDSETNLCTIHDNRPKVCSRYPFYGRERLPLDEFFYSESCGYKKLPEINLKHVI